MRGLISRFRSLCSMSELIRSASTDLRYDWPGPRRVYVVIIRETGVLARRRDPNSVAVSNWADRTDWMTCQLEIEGEVERTWNMVRRRCSSRDSY